MVLSKKLVNESHPMPYLKASSMELSATILHGNDLQPFPIVLQEDVQRDPGTVKGSESGNPASPFEHFSTNHDVPT